MIPLPMDEHFVKNIKFQSNHYSNIPHFFLFILEIPESSKVHDTFIDPTRSSFKKGVVFVNGLNLGRYWNIGPQKTLYLPGTWLHQGKNEIIIFEEMPDKNKEYQIFFTKKHELGPKNKRPA